jgi:CheY-like chemotaxis protein
MLMPRILVVEDEPVTAIDLRKQLINLGYDVPDPVDTGDHALRAIEQYRPDLILMDIKIKGEQDGIAMASRIAASYHIPIVCLTAYSDDATMARASAANPCGYLLKPISERELHAMTLLALPGYHAGHAWRAAGKFDAQSEHLGGAEDEPEDFPSIADFQPELASQVVSETFRRESDDAMRIAWRKSDGTLFASVQSNVSRFRYHLIVEQLPSRDAWDWAVWRSGDTTATARHGCASSQALAMTEAAGQLVEMKDPSPHLVDNGR